MSECTWVPPVYTWRVTIDHMDVRYVEATDWRDDGTWTRFYITREHLTCGDHTAIRTNVITMIERLHEAEDQFLTPKQA